MSYLKDAVMSSHSLIAEAEYGEAVNVLRKTLKLHESVNDGHSNFCATCVDDWGSAKRFPCKTRKSIIQVLELLGDKS